MDADCIFCKIARKEIPTNLVFEDEVVCAFRDLNPQAPTHILIIPKEHVASLADEPSDDVCAHIMHAAQVIAREEQLSKGWRLLTNVGDNAGQTVHHMHFHLLGGARLTDDLGAK